MREHLVRLHRGLAARPNAHALLRLQKSATRLFSHIPREARVLNGLTISAVSALSTSTGISSPLFPFLPLCRPGLAPDWVLQCVQAFTGITKPRRGTGSSRSALRLVVFMTTSPSLRRQLSPYSGPFSISALLPLTLLTDGRENFALHAPYIAHAINNHAIPYDVTTV